MSRGRKFRNESDIEEYLMELIDLERSEDGDSNDDESADDICFKLDENRRTQLVVGNNETDSSDDDNDLEPTSIDAVASTSIGVVASTSFVAGASTSSDPIASTTTAINNPWAKFPFLFNDVQVNKNANDFKNVRRNRIPNCKLPNESELKKYDRGRSSEFVANIAGVDISLLAWKDNKVVYLLSSYVGEKAFEVIQLASNTIAAPVVRNEATAKRFCKKNKTTVEIPSPNVVREYNKHMGGVDLQDSFVGRHKIQMKSRKWTNRIFYHLLDMALINSWVLYKRVNQTRKDQLPYLKLSEFRREVAEVLCGDFQNACEPPAKKGRPSKNLEAELQQRSKKPNAVRVPPKDIRKDAVGHWPMYDSKRQRCKLPTCEKKSFIYCSKCGTHLCLNASTNCFYDFHKN